MWVASRLLCALLVCLPAAFARSEDYRLLEIGGNLLKWDAPRLGARAEVTFGFVTAPDTFSGAINCGSMVPMSAMEAAWGSDPARLENIAAEAFGMWSGAAAIDFRRAAPNERPDILIGAQARPHRVAFANVWHDEAAAELDVAPLTRATICFNPEVAWTTDDRTPRSGEKHLRTVLAHEIGHAIGLDHPGATGTLMAFEDQGPQFDLKAGDIAGAIALYGQRRQQPLEVASGD